LTASDRYGRVIAEAVTSKAAPVTVTTDLGLRAGGTWYVKLGDAFAWVCVGVLALLIGWCTLRSRSQR
jgi:apolipoprotein N-acyltransferase